MAQPCAVRRQRRRADLPKAIRPRASAGRAPALRDARRHLLSGRCVARRRLPRRSRGLLLPPHLRHHQPVAPGERARAGGRGGVPATAQSQIETGDHRGAAELECDGSDVESRRHLATGADRNDRAGADRPVARAVPRRQRHTGPLAVARPARQRCGQDRASVHARRRRVARPARAIARRRAQRSRLEPRHQRSAVVVAMDARRAGADRRRGRDLGRRGRQRRPKCAHRDCAKSCCRTGSSRSTASRCS